MLTPLLGALQSLQNHHHQITQSSHSINAIGPAPTGAAERGSIMVCRISIAVPQICMQQAPLVLMAAVNVSCHGS
jgi:hypothetical protein